MKKDEILGFNDDTQVTFVSTKDNAEVFHWKSKDSTEVLFPESIDVYLKTIYDSYCAASHPNALSDVDLTHHVLMFGLVVWYHNLYKINQMRVLTSDDLFKLMKSLGDDFDDILVKLSLGIFRFGTTLSLAHAKDPHEHIQEYRQKLFMICACGSLMFEKCRTIVDYFHELEGLYAACDKIHVIGDLDETFIEFGRLYASLMFKIWTIQPKR